MTDSDDYDFRVWACETIIAMANVCLNAADPDAEIEDWFDQADERDEAWLTWAITMWKKMRTMNSFELESARRRARDKNRDLWRLRKPE